MLSNSAKQLRVNLEYILLYWRMLVDRGMPLNDVVAMIRKPFGQGMRRKSHSIHVSQLQLSRNSMKIK